MIYVEPTNIDGCLQSCITLDIYYQINGGGYGIELSDQCSVICVSPCKSQMQCPIVWCFICFHTLLITFCNLTLQISDGDNNKLGQQQPTLQMVSNLLNSVTLALERVGEEKYLLLNKVFNLLSYLSH